MTSETYSETIRRQLGADAMKGKADRAELYEIVDGLLEGFSDLRAQIKALEGRAETLEKSGTRFRGVYQRAQTYRRGDQVTHKGSLWTCLTDAPENQPPEQSPGFWQLCAKGAG